jgi:hypothetical protein
MSLIALLAAASLAVPPSPTLILERVRAVDDPRVFDLRDQLTGDRGVPKSCSLAGKTTVTIQIGKDATLEVDHDGTTKTIVIENSAGLGRSTLACGASDDFYYVNPRQGQIHAYSVRKLFQGEDPVVWSRQVEPFKSLDAVDHVLTDASVATALQMRQHLVLVEWLFRKNGNTGFWHEVFDAETGAELAKIGPSDLLLKLNEHDPWWIAFQGGGNETANYVPRNIYRLRYGPPQNGSVPAAATIDALRSSVPPERSKAVAPLSKNPVINHMIALLSPTRTSLSTAIEFCPAVPGERARYWLGGAYDPMLADVARNILLAAWAERETAGMSGSPIDAWFQAEIAPKEPMKTLLTRFNPQDDAWIAGYQQALLSLSGPTLEGWFEKYGTATGAVIRIPEPRDPR